MKENIKKLAVCLMVLGVLSFGTQSLSNIINPTKTPTGITTMRIDPPTP